MLERIGVDSKANETKLSLAFVSFTREFRAAFDSSEFSAHIETIEWRPISNEINQMERISESRIVRIVFFFIPSSSSSSSAVCRLFVAKQKHVCANRERSLVPRLTFSQRSAAVHSLCICIQLMYISLPQPFATIGTVRKRHARTIRIR